MSNLYPYFVILLIVFLQKVRHHILLLLSKNFLANSFQKFNYNVSWCGFIYIYSVWNLLSFLNVEFTSLPNLESFQPLYLFPPCNLKHFFIIALCILSSGYFTVTHSRPSVIISQVPGALLIFFLFILFFPLLFRLRPFLSFCLQFTDSFLCLLSPSTELFFFSSLCIFSLKTSIWLFFMFYDFLAKTFYFFAGAF